LGHDISVFMMMRKSCPMEPSGLARRSSQACPFRDKIMELLPKSLPGGKIFDHTH